ncbi:MAG TPA: diguanylate cyclase [Candidatus Polarisedimenticolia bacterium]|nr:diguanylate cyclase [Candidatus Polarisedimenticolia bacterium]
MKNVRAEDFFGRFGGEEFVVILSTADLGDSVLEPNGAVENAGIDHHAPGQVSGMVTISVGVAAFPEHGMSPKELMAAADAAFYEAK